MKYRKKPIVIDAFKWTADIDQTEDPVWCIEAMHRGDVWFNNVRTPDVTMEIKTLEGNHIANTGDYIIRGIAGEIYPCKPDIFEATYELAEEEDEEDTHSLEVFAFDELSLLAEKFISKYGTPHSTIIITQTGIEHADGRMANAFELKG